MRKLLGFVIVCSLISGFALATSSSAAPKPPKLGSSCTKAGLFFDTPNLRYVCNVEGKKKVWREWTPKGVKGASDSQAKNSASNFVVKIPITIPVAQKGPITFSNILDHIDEIPTVSYGRIQDVINSNSNVAVKNSVYVGPTTQIYIDGGLTRIQEVLARTAQLWSGFSQPKFYSIYIYNGTDEKLAEDKFTLDFKTKGYFSQNPEALAAPIRALAGNCQVTLSPGTFGGSVGECRGANSGAYSNSDDSFLQLGQSDLSKNDPNTKDAVVIGHEYSHSVAQGQWINNPNCIYSATGEGCNRNAKSNQGFSPCWLYEGLPQANGAAVAESSLNGYMSWRKNIPYGWGPTTITDYTASSLKDYLYKQSNSTCYQNGNLYVLGYSVGALTTEALIAIGGPQATMALFSQGAQGLDFATAFHNVYGITWDSASTILSKVLAAEYATFGPAPK